MSRRDEILKESLAAADYARCASESAASEFNMGPTASGALEPGKVMDADAAPLMEGVLNTDGYLHIQKDDVLVLITPKKLWPPDREKEEEAISERLGVKTVIIAAGLEVVGVVEHGKGIQ